MRRLLTLLVAAALGSALSAVAPAPAHAAGPKTTLVWASETTLTGLAGSAKGRLAPATTGATGFVEVAYKGGWARIATAATNARGEFVVPLNYGRTASGEYTFRMGTTTMLTRTEWSIEVAYAHGIRGTYTFRLAYHCYRTLAAVTRSWTLTRY